MGQWSDFRWGDGTAFGQQGEILVYRLPALLYRGAGGPLYRGPYLEAGGLSPAGGPALPRRPAICLKFYDRDDILFAQVSSNSQWCPLGDLRFDLLPTGPGRASFTLLDLPWSGDDEITHRTRVDIHVWNSSEPWWSGLIERRRGAGSTADGYEFEAAGLYSETDRVVVSAQYSSPMRVHQVVDELARQLEDQTRVVYSSSQIATSDWALSGDLIFRRTPFRDAMRQLANLAGGYEWGVDAQRRFYFRPASTDIAQDSMKWVGPHLERFEPEEDSSRVRNRLWISSGAIRLDLNLGDLLYKTNWLDDPLEDAGVGSSQDLYGVSEGVVRAPNILSVPDAIRYASVELERLKAPITRAPALGVVFEGELIEARGYARVTGRGRAEYELPKRRVTYEVRRGAHVDVRLELGEDAERDADLVADLVRRQAEEELRAQSSQPLL